MKKLTIFMICAAVLLASCTQTTPPSPTVSPSPAPTAAPEPSPEPSPEPETVPLSVGVLRGPSGMGMACLMDEQVYSSAVGANLRPERPVILDYNFTLASSPAEVTAMLASGELDIAALPSNTAAALYNKLNGAVKALALTTRGVLYILEKGDEVHSIGDLRGRTVYMFGQGANPEYALNHVLRENGLEPGVDVFIEFRENEELVTLAAAGMVDLCMLPVPSSTAVLMRNGDFRSAIELNDEWDKLGSGGQLIMTCVVVRTAFLEAHPEAVRAFLEEYSLSLSAVTDLAPGVCELMASLGIVGSPAIAENAIPYSNLCFITGPDMQPAIEGYYEVLFAADPASVGGALPDEDFYSGAWFK